MIPTCKKIYLCRPHQKKITLLTGVDVSTVNYDAQVKDYDTLSFELDRFIEVGGIEVTSAGYEDLHAYMQLYLEDIGFFEMQEPVTNNDGFKERKTITAYSLEKQFENHDWFGLKINTGESDSLEYLATDNIDDLGYAKKYVTLYNKDKEDLSLLHLILEKMPGWSVHAEDIDPLLWDVRLSIEEDNINLYALLTSVIAPKAECIFMFDTINKRIKAYSKHSLEFETNIFIGFRNLLTTVDIDCSEDSVYTRFNVAGDGDLSIENVNYGDSRIFDLSYFMTEPYMKQALIDKLTAWTKFRDKNRDTYIDLAKQWADLTDKISEITLRQPIDGSYHEQWDEMEEELLHKNLKYYNALLISLQISVDSNPQYATDTDGNEIYKPWLKSNNEIDHDRYLSLLYDMANGYGGYYTYYEVLNYVIPNIEIAISNLDVPTEDRHDYIKEYETNWDLYGISELEAKQKSYENQLDILTQKGVSKPWDELTDEEKANYSGVEEQYNASGRPLYLEYKGYLGDESTPGTLLYKLKKLKDEVAELNTQLDDVTNQRTELAEKAKMEHPQFGFTDEDIIIINELFHDTDYSNANILTTSVDTTLTTIDVQKELYDDAVSKLSEVSQPQYSFETDMDNLLYLPAFKDMIEDFALLRYIRLGIRDDYSVKLRLIGMSWNPCDVTPDLKVTFSNMITSRSGRNDLTDILMTENNRGSKNSISVGTGNSTDDKDYANDLLQMMIRSQLFSSSVGNIINSSSAIINAAQINSLISDYAKILTLDVGKITGDEASFNKLFADYIDVDYIVAELGKFGGLIADNITSATGNFTKYLTGVNVIADIVNAGTLSVERLIIRGTDENGDLGNSIMYYLNTQGNITAEDVDAADVENYQLNGKIIVAESITSTQINVHDLWVTGLAEMLNANIGNAWIENLTAITSQIGNWWIADNEITGNKYSVLTGGFLKSTNYETDPSDNAIAGCLIDLNDFIWNSPNFKIDEKNNVTIKGNLTLLPGSSVPSTSVITGDLKVSYTTTAYLATESGAVLADYDGKVLSISNIFTFYYSSADDENADGWVFWNNEKITIPRFSVPFSYNEYPRDILCYVVYRTSDQTPYVVWFHRTLEDDDPDKWVGIAVNQKECFDYAWNNNTDIVLGTLMHSTINANAEYILYREPKQYFDIRMTTMVSNWAYDGLTEYSTIRGDVIEAGTILADKLATNAIMSHNYGYEHDKVWAFDEYPEQGSFLNLANGYLITPYLKVTDDGGYFKGNVYADGGRIACWNIDSSAIYTGSYGVSGMYFGTSGLSLGSTFKVTPAGGLTATGGSLACWNFDGNKIYRTNEGFGASDGMYFGVDGLSIGSNFKVGSNGVATLAGLVATGVDITGKITATSGKIGFLNVTGTSLTATSSDGVTVISLTTSNVTAPNITTNQITCDSVKGLVVETSGATNFVGGGINENGIPVSLETHEHRTLTASGYIVELSDSGLWFRPTTNNVIGLGSASNRWTRLYQVQETISTSDENEKTDITSIDERYENMFMDLQPVTYKFRNFTDIDKHDRIHCGLGAQTTLAVAQKHGLDEMSFAAVCYDDLDEPTSDGRTRRFGMAYGELHGLEIHMIQKNAHRIEALEEENEELKRENQDLRSEVDDLKLILKAIQEKLNMN